MVADVIKLFNDEKSSIFFHLLIKFGCSSVLIDLRIHLYMLDATFLEPIRKKFSLSVGICSVLDTKIWLDNLCQHEVATWLIFLIVNMFNVLLVDMYVVSKSSILLPNNLPYFCTNYPSRL